MTFCRTWWERRCKGQFVCAKHLHFFGHLSNHFELTRKNSKNNRHKNWQIYKSTRKFLISKFFVFRKFSNFREIFMKFREKFEILLQRRNEFFFYRGSNYFDSRKKFLVFCTVLSIYQPRKFAGTYFKLTKPTLLLVI